LRTSQHAYVAAINSRDHATLSSLIDDDATFWPTVEPPLFTDGLAITNTRWFVSRRRWEALSSYDCEYTDAAVNEHEVLRGHGSDLLKVIDGNWQLVYSHRSAT